MVVGLYAGRAAPEAPQHTRIERLSRSDMEQSD